MITFAILIIISYLLGSIPSSYILGKLLKGIDIRNYGSKNVGFTNAFRYLGWRIGIAVLFFDILKGIIPAYHFPQYINENLGWISSPSNSGLVFGMTTIIGHMFTVFLKFKGGKGVATSLGVFLALTPIPLIIAASVSIALIFLTKYVSLGSIIGSILLPILIKVFSPQENIIFIVSALLCLFVIYKHRQNIKRLLKGEELPLKQMKISKE